MTLLNTAGVKIRDRFRSQANEMDATSEIVSFKNCGSHLFFTSIRIHICYLYRNTFTYNYTARINAILSSAHLNVI